MRWGLHSISEKIFLSSLLFTIQEYIGFRVMNKIALGFILILYCCSFLFSQIPSDRNALLNGLEGDYGKTAEINSYPSPKSLLELATTLNLSSIQKSRLSDIHNSTVARAKQLGKEIVQIENELNQAFQGRIINEKSCADDALQIGRLRGKLRGVILNSHIKAKAVLNDSQLSMYKKLHGEVKHK